MKYIIGIILTCSIGLNLAFIASLKRYQIAVIENKKYASQKIFYYEYWSFTFPREVNSRDTGLIQTRFTYLEIGDREPDSSLPQKDYYVEFSHE